MKLNKLFAALAAAGLAVAMGSAQASISFSFNPNGTGAVGAIAGITTIDQAPGSTLALNATNAGGPIAVGSVLTNLYQANLNSLIDLNSTNLFGNGGAGGKFFTFVANFTEQVTGSSVGLGGVSNTFKILSGTFKMCAQAAAGDNLAGTGFACAGDGILSGTINGGFANQTGNPAALVPLDGAGANNWPGVTTVRSNGSADLSAKITFADAGYFPDLDIGTRLILSTINSSLITPYGSVNPSRLYSSDTVANGDVAANIGLVNGITGPNFMFQSDANASFSVPEPGSLALVGLALAGFSLLRRRKQ